MLLISLVNRQTWNVQEFVSISKRQLFHEVLLTVEDVRYLTVFFDSFKWVLQTPRPHQKAVVRLFDPVANKFQNYTLRKREIEPPARWIGNYHRRLSCTIWKSFKIDRISIDFEHFVKSQMSQTRRAEHLQFRKLVEELVCKRAVNKIEVAVQVPLELFLLYGVSKLSQFWYSDEYLDWKFGNYRSLMDFVKQSGYPELHSACHLKAIDWRYCTMNIQ